MLKALELVGFKSFPDKTRFEFPPGITVVVGPNGSGKSNIVDAMKWVLGEQSARSLRGKEMADVIFKGSAQGKRKPANTAQVTIIFDNTAKILPLDEAEVHVTRRVYRSGEGEYLINGEACRLRDIKDMFRGTGVGTDAYSLIEQGKVDSLLRASPRDRRAFFEEAAGISRFKAKKVEAQRRLERVEQNLLRLSDIVDEVRTRLNRVKSQATKAQRYKEHTERLQNLRTQVGRVDWQRFSEELGGVEISLAALGAEMQASSTELELHETELRGSEQELTSIEDETRDLESRASSARERAAACETVIDQQQVVHDELVDESANLRERLKDSRARAAEIAAQVAEVETSCNEVEAVVAKHREAMQDATNRRDALLADVHRARSETETRRENFVIQMREAADLGNRISAHESQLTTAVSTIETAGQRRAEIEAELESARAAHDQCENEAQHERARNSQIEEEFEQLQSQLSEDEASFEASVQEVAQLKQRHAALVARASVLEEIERRMEGVGSGVKEILEKARHGDPVFSGVRGMVADIVNVVDGDKARMVEVALGERAEHLVVAGQQLFEYLEGGRIEFPGRVGFLRLQSTPPPSSAVMVDLDGQPGVIGRADRFVQTTTEYEHLVSWLMRDTWFVETIADAIQFHRSVHAPIRLVTRNGELLDRDGRLVVGPHETGIGLISRRSELRAVNDQTSALGENLKARELKVSRLESRLGERHNAAKNLSVRRQRSFEALTKIESKVESAAQELEKLGNVRDRAQLDFVSAKSSHAEVNALLTSGREQLSALEAAIKLLESTLSKDRSTLAEKEEQLEARQLDVTESEVLVAKSEQQLDALRTRTEQLTKVMQDRNESVAATEAELGRNFSRGEQAKLHILEARSESSELAIVSEQCAAALSERMERRLALQAKRKEVAESAADLRSQIRSAEQQLHSHELEAEKLRHQRDTLASRLEEDYGISTAQLGLALSGEEESAREEVDAEIESLRRKISNLGSVNMDALADLDDLESRYKTLDDQHQDLIDAKEALEKIIAKINADSRRLFAETLEVIRENFSRMFRKVFGGGRADIVLEEGVDILEAGIDIVATPPGKHSLALSLLSGGERALTAVTLLLAIFEYRPSPFCVLDEVDGPLDEANIGRFIEVLREFLQWTKFVVVTHSKRTMTAANTLYGVTMQESGVSKRVAVRFEDVREGGEISDEAIRRSHRDGGDDDERGAA